MNNKYRAAEFVHNSDLFPDEAYLATLGRLRVVFDYEPLKVTFLRYDRVANVARIQANLAGVVSLTLAVIALCGAVVELLLPALTEVSPAWIAAQRDVPVSASGIFAICLILSAVLAGLSWRRRTEWLTCRFMTESIRQWLFQLFADGATISSIESEPESFTAIRDRRWARFLAQAPSARGSVSSFVISEDVDLHHDVTLYASPQCATTAFHVYNDLRLNKQLAYFQLKSEELSWREAFADAVGRWAFLCALLLAGGQITLALFAVGGVTGTRGFAVLCAAAALAFVVVSAATRAYQSGGRATEDRERYASKWARLATLKRQFGRDATPERKVETIMEIEVALTEELRSYLRTMRASSYLV